MKRDMDLCRAILFEVEKLGDPLTSDIHDFGVPGYERALVSYHVEILGEAGLIQAQDLSDMRGSDWMPTRLTWSGHEFLDAARNDTIWNKAKSKVAEVSTGASLDVLKLYLKKLMMDALGLSAETA